MNRLLTLARDVRSIRFSSDGSTLLVTFRDTDWVDTLGGAWIDPTTGFSDQVACVLNAGDLTFLPDGRGFIFSTLFDDERWSEVGWYEYETEVYQRIVGNLESAISRVVVAAESGTIFIDSRPINMPSETRPELRLWGETPAGEVVRVLNGRPLFTCSPDGTRVAIVSKTEAFSGIYARNGTARTAMPFPESATLAHWPTHDRLILASASEPLLTVWDGVSTVPLLSATHTDYSITTVDVSPDGRWIVAGCGDGVVRVWGLDSPEPVANFAWGIGEIRGVACSPDGLTCVAAGERGRVVLWDFET